MTGDEAQILALEALGWLAGQEELWQGFLGESGLAAGEVRALAGAAGAPDPGFLAAVLEYLTRHDGWITAFCDARGLAYTRPMAARRALPGGDDPHWT